MRTNSVTTLRPATAARILDLGEARGSRHRGRAAFAISCAIALFAAHAGTSGGFLPVKTAVAARAATTETHATEDGVMKRLHAAGLTMVFAGLASNPSIAQNRVANGDFEAIAPPPNLGCHFSFPDTPLVGWQMEGWHDVDGYLNTPECTTLFGGIVHPSGGQIVVSLQGSICCECNNNGAIRQVVAVEAGSTHRLSIDVFLDPWDALAVSVDGQAWTITPGAPYEWRTVEFEFVPSAPAVTLRLASVGTSNAPACLEADFAIVDNVRIESAVCVGDVTGNGAVDAVDLAAVLAAWGSVGKGKVGADVDGSGMVDALDLAEVLNGWGACP